MKMNKTEMKRIMRAAALAAVAGCWGVAAVAQERLSVSAADCRQMALAHSEDLRRADNAVRQAELDKAVAFAAYLPQLDAMATATYMYPDLDMMGMELQMRGMYMAGISLTQPLYAGGQIKAGNELAAIGRDCAEENRKKTRMDVLANADRAYWNFIAVGRKVRMLDAYKRQMDTLYAQMEASLAAEMVTENDLLRISAKRSEIDYQWQRARNGADLCRLALCNVLGCPLETEIEATDTVPDVELPLQMVESTAMRPELRLLQKQVEAKEQQVKMARADVLPKLGLSAGYMYYGNVKLEMPTEQGAFTQSFDDGISLVMASLSVPVFHWGQGLKKVKKARLDVENAKLDLQKNARLMSIEVRQAIQNVTDGYRLVETARLGCRQADESLRVTRDRYRNAMCSLTDLLDVQSQWQQAQSNLIEAQAQYKIYETEYLKATGTLE